MNTRLRICLALAAALTILIQPLAGQRRYTVHQFEKTQLDKDFYCEGATLGDIDRDGKPDLISGPFWWKGPAFETRHAFYAPKKFSIKKYSDNFFAFVHDLNADGWNDIVVIGFPGKDASWYENPKGGDQHWTRHVVFSQVDNESPTFADLTGDGKPELICQTKGHLGYATPDWAAPHKPWTFHAIAGPKMGGRFTHGLGHGDINGDGRQDVLFRLGWFEQPASLEGDPQWKMHLVNFAGRGGAQMYAYDIDGDGDNDVVSSHNAHGYGLYWFEQVQKDGKIAFEKHRIMGDRPQQSRYGVAFGNLHAMAVLDMDGDGLLDLVTGNRYWAHGGGDKADRQPASLAWFKLVRTKDRGVEFEPHIIDEHSGVGTQVVAGDIDGDGYPEVVVGNKMGTFVHRHRAEEVTRVKWMDHRREYLKRAAARLEVRSLDRTGGYTPKGEDGKPLNLNFETGDLTHWTATGDAFTGTPVKGDTVRPRRSDMRSEHQGAYWIGTYEPGESDKTTGTLTSQPFVVTDRYASFLVGGGDAKETRVELVRADTEEVIFSVSGKARENLRPRTVDLKDHLEKKIFIRLVDTHKGHWGHINFDDFLLHKSDPWGTEGEKKRRALDKQVEGFSPAEAAKRMGVPKGFEVDLVAGEPDLHQPIGFCIDGKGRLWVAEAYSYPIRKKGDKAKDKIVCFEDTDADGTFDKRTVFVDDLNLVSGIEVGFGGVWVGAAPYFMFIPDQDDDLKPDGEPQILLDGFGFQDTHETLNAFNWGPDGWLYGCHGVFTHSKVGKPGTPARDRTPMNAAVWRYHPVRHEFEVFAHGASNQWGVDFNDQGQAFITACVIPHLYHVIQGGRYQRQAGSHFNRHTYDDIKTIADHLHYLGAKPHEGNGVSTLVGGGHAHCGAMIYLGDAFPKEYRNRIFMANIHGNRINTDVLVADGSGYVGSHGPDFLMANDKWFRGINMRYGPNGHVYLIDWYDKQACHRKRPEIWDRTNGRLYRVRYGAFDGKKVDIAGCSDADLIALQMHANDWHVRQARIELQHRGGKPAVWQGLLAALQGTEDATRQLRLMWALHATGGFTEGLALQMLDQADAFVRAWAIQLTTEDREVGDPLADKLVSLAQSDPSPVVRLYLASAMQRAPAALGWRLAEALVAHGEDEGDHNLPLMVWYGLEPLVAAAPDKAAPVLAACKLTRVTRFIYRRMAGAGPAGVDAVLAALAGAKPGSAARRTILGEMVTALKKRDGVPMPAAWPALYRELIADPAIAENAMTLGVVFGDRQVLPKLRGVLADRTVRQSRRQWALDNLLRVKDPEAVGVLQQLVDDPKMADKAIRGLRQFDDARTPKVLLARFPELKPTQQNAVVATLTTRKNYTEALLQAVIAKEVPRTVLNDAATRRQIRNFKNPGIDKLMTEAWGQFRPMAASKQKQIEAWKAKITDQALGSADLAQGRALFSRTCMACHKLFGQGSSIGPDITGSNRDDLDYILSNIIDPSGEVAKDYMLTSVETKDGGFFAGVIVDENDSTLTLRNVAGESQQIARKDIALEDGKPSITTMPISLMPEGQLLGMSDQDVINLIAYLGADLQVDMAATKGSLGAFFNGRDFTNWEVDPAVWSVEDGEIVGRTKTGLAANNFAKSQMVFGDFRLIVDVKLVDNAGNSGIQFRSRREGKTSMWGYQADIGKDWWGKLYEEHGRKVLWAQSGEAAVKPGGWNTYEILAVGGKIRTALNGTLCVDLDDPKGARSGIFALQVHSGGPTEVRFRNFRLELDPKFELKTAAK